VQDETMETISGARAALLDVKEVAGLLSCSPRTVYRLADAGRIPAPVRLGTPERGQREPGSGMRRAPRTLPMLAFRGPPSQQLLERQVAQSGLRTWLSRARLRAVAEIRHSRAV